MTTDPACSDPYCSYRAEIASGHYVLATGPDVRDCECVPGHRCDCIDLRQLLYDILTRAEYQKMEAEGLAAKALGLRWSEANDRYIGPYNREYALATPATGLGERIARVQRAVAALMDRLDYVNGADAGEVVREVNEAVAALSEQSDGR